MQLRELNLERNKMNTEKVNLENQLEAEQEYILNKLHKQVKLYPWDTSCSVVSHISRSCGALVIMCSYQEAHLQMPCVVACLQDVGAIEHALSERSSAYSCILNCREICIRTALKQCFNIALCIHSCNCAYGAECLARTRLQNGLFDLAG